MFYIFNLGQDILMDEFNKGAYATVVVKGMDAKGIEKIEDKIENVEHVTDIISYNVSCCVMFFVSVTTADIPLMKHCPSAIFLNS